MQPTNYSLRKIGINAGIWAVVWVFLYLGQIQLPLDFAAWNASMVVLSQCAIFNCNIYWKKKSKTFNYRLKTIGLLSLMTIVNLLIENLTETRYLFIRGERDWYTPFSMIIFVFFNLCAFFASELFILQQEYYKNQSVINKLKEQQAVSQLELLKSKINPHFLFNSLNTIYTLSYLDNEKTSEKIMQLSEMLRYVLYDCDVGKVPVTKEVNYLKAYMDFNLSRGKYGQNIDFRYENHSENAVVAPMLLLPFVENAYKYSGILHHKEAYINISIEVNKNNINFLIENSVYSSNPNEETFIPGGIGLNNIKKRLELQYSGKYSLNISSKEDIFRVMLILQL
ncbi:MAG: histidine kinase [Flavobacteriaceae bacterium]|nr:histidine kinase [Flavobacteriaceae bacterium]